MSDFFEHDEANAGKGGGDDDDEIDIDRYNELVYKAVGASWDEVPGSGEGLPPPLILHSQLRFRVF